MFLITLIKVALIIFLALKVKENLFTSAVEASQQGKRLPDSQMGLLCGLLAVLLLCTL